MDLSITGKWLIEVDGTLANPMVLKAVLIWCAFVSIVSFILGRSIRHASEASSHRRFLRRFIPLLGLLVLMLISPLAEFLITNLLYRLDRSDIGSVGLWGGPPWWPFLSCGGFSAVMGFVLVSNVENHTQA